MSPALANFIFEAANFLLLVAALGWVLFKPVRRALDSERDRHKNEEEESKRLRSEAESLARDARAVWEAAEHEAIERRREALAAADKEAARLLENARKEQATERQALERELAITRSAEALALADLVGRIAAESVIKLLDVLRGPSLDAALVGAACKELASVPRPARTSALVESARPLGVDARRLLRDALGGEFQERVVEELGAGVRVTAAFGHGRLPREACRPRADRARERHRTGKGARPCLNRRRSLVVSPTGSSSTSSER